MRADELHLFCDLQARHRRRALRQHDCRQMREAGPVRRVAGRARVDDEAHRHGRQAGGLDVENIETVVQFLASRDRRAEGARRCAARHCRPVNFRAGSCLDRVFGHNGHTDPVCSERLHRHAHYVLGGDGAVPLDIGVDKVWIAPERVEQVQLVGSSPEAPDLLQSTHVIDLEQVEGRPHLSLGWRLAANAFKMLLNDLLDLVEALAGVRRDLHDELPRDLPRVVGHRHVARDSHVVDERLVQSGALAVAHNRRQYVQRGLVVVEHGAGWPDKRQAGKLYLVAHVHSHFAGQAGVHPSHSVDGRAWGDIAEVALHQTPRLVGIEVARNAETGVRRHVVRAKEIRHVVERRGVQVLLRADHGPVVRMRGRKDRRLHCQMRLPVRSVLIALSPLVLHHVALQVEPLLIERLQQEPHTVGLQPQDEFEVVRRRRRPVVRAVVGGRAVDVRPDFFKRLEKVAVVVLRPLEHDVLEQVREAGPTWLLVLRSDVVPQVHRHHGQRVVSVQYHVQAVRQRIGFKINREHS